MPLQPYSQPSGPHTSELKMLCLVSIMFQPSSFTSGLPGLSPSRMGTNSKFGDEQSHTPPKPISMPERFTPLSMNTVFLSKVPSPSVSSRITTRSLPLPFFDQFG